MKGAFVLGGTGFVGRHVARRLAEGGWDVTVASRGETAIPSEVADVRHVQLDRSAPGALETALGSGTDVLIDVIPYEPRDAEQVLHCKDLAGSIVAISTTSVYADDLGHTMDEAVDEESAPRMPVPILETQPRAEPGPETYSTKKVAIEDKLLGQGDVPVSVIRPCAIYGPGDTQCREWFFVRRALDGRPFVLLADEGRPVFHTTSVHNLAELVRLVSETPVHGAFNCGDPGPPEVRRIAASIAAAMGHEWEEVLLPREMLAQKIARTPWSGWHPWVVSMDQAETQLGFRPVTTYEDAIRETVEWIVHATRDRDWREVLPKAAEYPGDRFDYEAEDEVIRSLD